MLAAVGKALERTLPVVFLIHRSQPWQKSLEATIRQQLPELLTQIRLWYLKGAALNQGLFCAQGQFKKVWRHFRLSRQRASISIASKWVEATDAV